ncbi:MAG TPA: acyloxyacyl hydrolase [Candidatus Acidoferrum sp.]|nr:acyloxyacyl hydrolase [Candidatus Acidoferrum sp.]
MRLIAAALLFLAVCHTAKAQATGEPTLSAELLQKGAWEFGPEIGGGPSTRYNIPATAQFLYFGGRIGRVLSGPRLHDWRRGRFEMAADILPFYKAYTSGGTVYGGSFRPLVCQWNFEGGRHVAPYISLSGGVLFTTRNIPPGNTSPVNFTPGGAFGTRVFTGHRAAIFIETSVLHMSNADLGVRNPGYPVSILFNVGYTWFKRPK